MNHLLITKPMGFVIPSVKALPRFWVSVQVLIVMVSMSSAGLAHTTQTNPKTADNYLYKNTEALRFNPKPPPVIQAPVQAGAPLDALCAGIENSYECAQAIERHQLEKPENARSVTRQGAELRLKLEQWAVANN